ncbi:MAG: TfoX/Sxy family protein [Myxococcota bacterium]
MAYDEGLAERLRTAFEEVDGVAEKRMFGGLAFMVAGHMTVGVVGEQMMVRVGAERHAQALARPHARPMDFTGRKMTGFVYVAPEGFASDEALESWVRLALEHTRSLPPKAPAARRKK